MNLKHLGCLMILLFLLSSCSSKMKITGNSTSSLTPLRANESVVIIEENENLDQTETNAKIGSFEIKDGGLSLDCSYERVQSLAKDKARSVGGNTVKITEHKLPGTWSTCHRIKFEVYKIADITPYQEEMIWSANNKLKWEYFKAPPKFERNSMFCGFIDVQFNDIKLLNDNGKVNINPIFLFECSYVQPSEKSENLLDYNQVKFDLLEVYARKMRSEFDKSSIDTLDEWTKFAQNIYDKVQKEYETDIYNYEVETNFGQNHTEVVGWQYMVKNELEELTEYSSDRS
ncbi:hypothetical protein MKO06_13040 [Gramella sp. GC03-9]|uniref:Lipoprotein n=1 Tax=Christiangramia oceanisediminis TaxID=2920386 RepID=A0A9X2KZ16_9FLAO|nr:hypothetical protein [Gramella oceanisediminis]MCP9200839.1 hypothetical protein [Gramella oceanisediminis]